MPINADHHYFEAEKKYLEAQTNEEKIARLEELIRAAPKHKSSENLVAGLRLRLKKFKEKREKAKKSGGGRKGIKKEGYQAVLVGLTKAGKSSLLEKLTNARATVSAFPFATKESTIGTMDYNGVKVQIVDMPSIGSEEFDVGLANTADAVLIVVDKLEDIPVVEKNLWRTIGKRIVVFNKIDLLSANGLRKLRETIRSRKVGALLISCFSGEGIDELKEAVFTGMNAVRIYLKEPGKEATRIPMVLERGATVKDVAEKILKGFASRVKEARVTGPSGKFPNQKVGLAHEVKDLDVVEFKTK